VVDQRSALCDGLFDQLARLDELYELGERRAGAGMRPVFGHLRQQVHCQAADLLAGPPDLAGFAAGMAASLAGLDHVPGMAVPIECEYLLHDLLGVTAEHQVTPPVILSISPGDQSGGSVKKISTLQLPVIYRESPLPGRCWQANSVPGWQSPARLALEGGRALDPVPSVCSCGSDRSDW
jgi:hypothetical protein